MFAENSRYVEYEDLLKEMQRLIAEGRGASEEADALRAAMEPLERALSDAERARLNGLSTDLAMFQGREVFDQTARAGRARRRAGRDLREAWVGRDWEALLTLLRKGPDFLPADAVAFFRFSAYDALGHHDTALLFLRHAIQRNPRQASYKEILLSRLTRLDRLAEAATLAESLIEDASTPTHVLVNAAHVLFRTARTMPEAEARPRYVRVVAVLERALAGARPSLDLPSMLIAAAYIVLGDAQETLGDPERARTSYDQALEVKPDYAEAWAARGQLRLATDPEGALSDFEQAVAQGTKSLAPYLHLARHFLLAGRYERALEYSLRILDRTDDPHIRDLALDWVTIAYTELEQPDDTVRERGAARSYAVSSAARRLEGVETLVAQASRQDRERLLEALAPLVQRPLPEARLLALLLAK